MTIVFTDGKFREGVGTFDYAPNAFDETLIISSIGITAYIEWSFKEIFLIILKKLIVIIF